MSQVIDQVILQLTKFTPEFSLLSGEESDIIFSFGTSTLRASYGFVLEPRRIIFNPVNKTNISSVRIYQEPITGSLQLP